MFFKRMQWFLVVFPSFEVLNDFAAFEDGGTGREMGVCF